MTPDAGKAAQPIHNSTWKSCGHPVFLRTSRCQEPMCLLKRLREVSEPLKYSHPKPTTTQFQEFEDVLIECEAAIAKARKP